MYNNGNDMSQLQSLVSTAERERASKNTTALQEYLDNHPQIAAITLTMTEEVKHKLLLYMSSADQSKQSAIQEELEELRRQLDILSEKPTILHTLLAEEVLISYLMLRCSDVMYSRHHAHVSTLGLRKMDMAQIRFLRALKTLANIHQRLPQIVNVNLGTQQIAMTT